MTREAFSHGLFLSLAIGFSFMFCAYSNKDVETARLLYFISFICFAPIGMMGLFLYLDDGFKKDKEAKKQQFERNIRISP